MLKIDSKFGFDSDEYLRVMNSTKRRIYISPEILNKEIIMSQNLQKALGRQLKELMMVNSDNKYCFIDDNTIKDYLVYSEKIVAFEHEAQIYYRSS